MLYSDRLAGPASSGSASNSASVYGCRGPAKSALVVVCSMIRPPYITATRSARPRDDAKVVGHQDDGHAELAAQVVDQLEDLALDGHVECGGRLVRDQQARLAGERGSDHRALTHPAGQLMRVLAGHALRLRHADQPSISDRAARPPARRSAPLCTTTDSAICRPIVMVGSRQLDGSWKTIPTSLPRTVLHVPLGQPGELGSGQHDRSRR